MYNYAKEGQGQELEQKNLLHHDDLYSRKGSTLVEASILELEVVATVSEA